MIRITRLTDYAIVLMTHCAHHADRPIHTARDLSVEAKLPLPTVGKLLKALVRRGLMTSHRGVNGGYSLARRSDQITVADVIEAIEGPVAITDCSSAEVHDSCELETQCPVRTNWQMINGAVWEALARITLAQLSQPMPAPFVRIQAPGPRLEAPKGF